VPRGSISRRDAIEGNVGRYIVSCHDVLHTTDLPVDVVPIIVAGVFQLVSVGPVELTLIAFSEPSLNAASLAGFQDALRNLGEIGMTFGEDASSDTV